MNDLKVIDAFREESDKKTSYTQWKILKGILRKLDVGIASVLAKAAKEIRLQQQCLHTQNFNREMEYHYGFLINETLTDDGGAPQSSLACSFTVPNETKRIKYLNDENSVAIASAAYKAQINAAVLNGVASVVCPSSNFLEACASMKAPKEDVCRSILEGIEGQTFLFVLPSIEGLSLLPDGYEPDNYEAVAVVRLYKSDLMNTNPELYGMMSLPLNLVKEIEKVVPDAAVEKLVTNFSSWGQNTSIHFDDLMMDFHITALDVKGQGASHSISSSRPASLKEVCTMGKSTADKQTEEVEALLMNLILMSVSNGGAFTTASLVRSGTSANKSVSKITGGKKKALKNLPVQVLKLNPDISLREVRKQEEEREFSNGTISPHWRRAHFHSFWKGSGESRHLGMPQLVKGFMVTGDKAKAKRERIAKRQQEGQE